MPAWWFDQLASLYAKLGRRDDEIAALMMYCEHYLANPAIREKFLARVERARRKKEQA